MNHYKHFQVVSASYLSREMVSICPWGDVQIANWITNPIKAPCLWEWVYSDKEDSFEKWGRIKNNEWGSKVLTFY